jgi:hypothetical protein
VKEVQKNRKVIVANRHADTILSGSRRRLFTTKREAEASNVGKNEEQFFERIDAFEPETVSRKANNFT